MGPRSGLLCRLDRVRCAAEQQHEQQRTTGGTSWHHDAYLEALCIGTGSAISLWSGTEALAWLEAGK
jgi:hypothetical protein